MIKLKERESIIRRGDRYTEWHVTVMEGIHQFRSKTYSKAKFVGTFLFVSLILFLFYNYGALFIKNFSLNRVDLMAIGFFICVTMLIQRIFFILADPIRNAMPFDLPATVFFYGVPIAFGAMLI